MSLYSFFYPVDSLLVLLFVSLLFEHFLFLMHADAWYLNTSPNTSITQMQQNSPSNIGNLLFAKYQSTLLSIYVFQLNRIGFFFFS